MEVIIDRLNHTGEGIGQIEKKVIFIPKTLPGDIVFCDNIIDCGNFYRATSFQLLKPSPNRVPSLCSSYEQCGGCQLLNLTYTDQLSYKKNKIQDILKKYADLEINPSITGTSPLHYRNKIILQVLNGKIGLYASASNELCPLTNCHLISLKMNEIITLMNDNLNLNEVKKIMIRQAFDELMVQIIGKINPTLPINLLKDKVASLYLNDTLIYGVPQIHETLGKYHFVISKDSFFQVNHDQTLNLYQQIKDYLGEHQNHVLDLYCGAATIGIFVSEYCKQVTGIECNSSSVKDAYSNIKNNHLTNVKVIKGDVAKILTKNNKYDAIIVDPPRSGLDKHTRRTLLEIKSPKIIYVSCNPITLARDLKDLMTQYDLKDLKLFDMFPNTYHVECVSVLQRKVVEK